MLICIIKGLRELRDRESLLNLPPNAKHFINAVSPWLKGPANLRKGIPFTLVIVNLLGGTVWVEGYSGKRERDKIRRF